MCSLRQTPWFESTALRFWSIDDLSIEKGLTVWSEVSLQADAVGESPLKSVYEHYVTSSRPDSAHL